MYILNIPGHSLSPSLPSMYVDINSKLYTTPKSLRLYFYKDLDLYQSHHSAKLKSVETREERIKFHLLVLYAFYKMRITYINIAMIQDTGYIKLFSNININININQQKVRTSL